jgi:enterochelin esterase-like enzyme
MMGVEYMKVHRRKKKQNCSRRRWKGLSHELMPVAST